MVNLLKACYVKIQIYQKIFGCRSYRHQHKAVMPRTMLRYAIERFPEDLRKVYLGK